MEDAELKTYSGRCYCNAVTFKAVHLRDIWYCHCTQCRSLTGHYMAACRGKLQDVLISGDLRWTRVSENSEHGFCTQCCSPMFWRNKTQGTISVVAGSIENTDSLDVLGHVFVSEKGAYYEITDGLPQFRQYPDEGV